MQRSIRTLFEYLLQDQFPCVHGKDTQGMYADHLSRILNRFCQATNITACGKNRQGARVNSVCTDQEESYPEKLQEICGFLNFIGRRCIIPGRAFTHRLYSYTSSQDGKLKPFHHIHINSEMHEDLKMWNQFVNDQNIYARSFIDFSKYWMAMEICMFSDTSRSENLGFGGISNTSWMYGTWPTGFIVGKEPSIEYLELFALVATVCNWIHRYANKRIILFCNNQSIVHMVNNTSSSCMNCMVLIRILVLKCLTENVRVFAKYVRSKDNYASDLLSRLKIKKFLDIGGWDEYPTEVPQHMWPIKKIWKDI